MARPDHLRCTRDKAAVHECIANRRTQEKSTLEKFGEKQRDAAARAERAKRERARGEKARNERHEREVKQMTGQWEAVKLRLEEEADEEEKAETVMS